MVSRIISNKVSMSGKATILQAAQELAPTSGVTFAETNLIIKAWELNKQLFGLRGQEETYPDARRVYIALCGPKGLIKKGFLSRQKDGKLRLVKEVTSPRLWAAEEVPFPKEEVVKKEVIRSKKAPEIQKPVVINPPPTKPVPIPIESISSNTIDDMDELVQVLTHCLNNEPMVPLNDTNLEDVSFSDACRFWNLDVSSSVPVKEQLDTLVANLKKIESNLCGSFLILKNGYHVDKYIFARLHSLHARLYARFSRDIKRLERKKVVPV